MANYVFGANYGQRPESVNYKQNQMFSTVILVIIFNFVDVDI